MPNKATYDEKIMAELLKQPGVREHVAKMHPDTLEFYKELLVREGVYARFVKEREEAARQAGQKGGA